MQYMSDKEFDKTVRDRFAGFEAEPPALVWNSIEAGLKSNSNTKKPFPVFWMAAASVIILMAAGLYLFRPKHKVWLQGTENARLKTVEPAVADTVSLQIPIQAAGSSKTAVKAVEFKAKQRVIAISEPELTTEYPDKFPEKVLTVDKAADQVMTQENYTLTKTPAAEVPGNIDTVKALAVISESSDSFSYQETKRMKLPNVRSVGDIVNFVVGKVDQREDKIIEFKQSDEGAEVSAINLGLLKYKSKKYYK